MPSGFAAKIKDHFPPNQFGRYLAIGVVNTVFGYCTFAFLTYILTPHVPHAYMLASFLAGFLNITFSFLNYKWFIFKTKGNYLREWVRCVLVYGSGIAIGLVVLPVLVFTIRHATRFDSSAPYIAGAILTGLTVVFGFLGHKKFSFAQG